MGRDPRGQERHQADHTHRCDSVRDPVRGRGRRLRCGQLHRTQGSPSHGSVHALRHGRGYPGGDGFGPRLLEGGRRSLRSHHGLRDRRTRWHRGRSDQLGTDAQPEEDVSVLHPEHHRQHGRGPLEHQVRAERSEPGRGERVHDFDACDRLRDALRPGCACCLPSNHFNLDVMPGRLEGAAGSGTLIKRRTT